MIEWDFFEAPSDVQWDPEAFEARLVTSFFKGCSNKQWMRRVQRRDKNEPSESAAESVVLSGADGKLTAATDDQQYDDWEAPLLALLRHIHRKSGSTSSASASSAGYKSDGRGRCYYDGVLGFSQGANLAVVLAALQEAIQTEMAEAETGAPADVLGAFISDSSGGGGGGGDCSNEGGAAWLDFKFVVSLCGSRFGWVSTCNTSTDV